MFMTEADYRCKKKEQEVLKEDLWIAAKEEAKWTEFMKGRVKQNKEDDEAGNIATHFYLKPWETLS